MKKEKGSLTQHYFFAKKIGLQTNRNNQNNLQTETFQKSGAGFTLIELLVVLAIIGLLAGVIMIALSTARVKARDAKRAGDIRQTISALEQYHIAQGIYPTGTASVASAGNGSLLSDANALNGSIEPMTPNYLPIIPVAPVPADGSCSSAGVNSNDYWYQSADDGSTYTITFCLGKITGQWNEGVRYATPDGVQ